MKPGAVLVGRERRYRVLRADGDRLVLISGPTDARTFAVPIECVEADLRAGRIEARD